MALYSSFGFFLAFMMAFGQLALQKRSYKNYVSFSFYFICGMVLLNSYLLFSHAYVLAPMLIQSHLPFMLSLPPLLFIYFKIIIEKKYNFSKTTILHFAPAIFGFIVYLLNFNNPAEMRLHEILRPFDKQELNVRTITYFLSAMMLLSYVSYMFYNVKLLFTVQSLKKSNLAKILLMAFCLTLIAISSLITMFIFRKIIFLSISNSILVTLLILLNIIGRRYPLFFEDLQTYVKEQSYQRSLIEGIDLKVLNNSLIHLMEVEKAYRDEDLNMNQVASLLDVSPHQFSQYINERLNKNFSTLINEYRIKAACKMVKEEPSKSILTIAYEVGFSSKSVFNKAFIKYTEMTPTQFRKADYPESL